MSMFALIEADLESEPRRREPRVPLSASVGLREFGTRGARARLLNLSSRGFMAELDGEIRPGSRVWLTLPGGDRVSAEIVWAKGCRLGGEFASPVDPLAVLHAAGSSLR